MSYRLSVESPVHNHFTTARCKYSNSIAASAVLQQREMQRVRLKECFMQQFTALRPHATSCFPNSVNNISDVQTPPMNWSQWLNFCMFGYIRILLLKENEPLCRIHAVLHVISCWDGNWNVCTCMHINPATCPPSVGLHGCSYSKKYLCLTELIHTRYTTLRAKKTCPPDRTSRQCGSVRHRG